MPDIFMGKITGYESSWGSGMATLIVELPSGEKTHVHADSGPLGRALGDMFDAYSPGHSINADKVIGHNVFFWMDEMGLTLGGLIPVETAPEELVELYESQQV